jgi:hypothetical protein
MNATDPRMNPDPQCAPDDSSLDLCEAATGLLNQQ